MSCTPEACLEHAQQLWKHARAGLEHDEWLEVFYRVAERVRLRLALDGSLVVERGRDVGVAVRLWNRAHRALGFAATNTANEHGIAWAIRQCRRNAVASLAGGPPWAARAYPNDVALLGSGPGDEALAEWIQRAQRHARESGVMPIWVEWGRTVDTLVADGGLRMLRGVSRCWALGREGGANRGERPVLIAGRTLDALDPLRWDLGSWRRPTGPASNRRSPWLILPHVAAHIVRTLLPYLREGRSDAPCFWVDDDPIHLKRIAGGVADDAGFPTRRQRVFPGAEEPAGRWRDSFWDPPRRRHGTLVLGGRPVELSETFVMIWRARVVPLGFERAYAELAGEEPGNGRTRRPWRKGVVWSPASWAGGVLGVVGEAVACPDGTVAPAILFEPPPE